MTLEERIQGLRLRALYRAVELGNASQVCRELGISRSAAKGRAERAYKKLNVNNRADAVTRARELGLIPN